MPPAGEILSRNLAALEPRYAELAARLRSQTPAVLQWEAARTDSETLTATLVPAADTDAPPVSLASRYDPVAEAHTLLESVDFEQAACVTLLGLGLGHAAQEVLPKLAGEGLLLIYEPDLALLRAVLERRDLSALWTEASVVLLCGDAETVDLAAVVSATERFTASLTQGTKLVTPPASRRRAADDIAAFGQTLSDVIAGFRTNVATAFVNAARTCRNAFDNLGVYAAGATTDDLFNAAQGHVAVCVGAGPSLVKNVDLLRDPAIRRKVVLIAVQTALRPLLDRGIRPDYVTALDYSPICARFYEGLPELPDVTLVAEPKANAAILDAFPGPVRTLASTFCDLALGNPAHGGMAVKRRSIPSGSTVAHLSYYLARHLGCDPVVLIGQDLGFSDGLYYAPGTAVHKVWECELGAFNTLEMMEWQRIMRMRAYLRRAKDIHGRPIFTDEQMATYLQQFERDFAKDDQAGRTTLDATEGGMPKAHTTAITLAEALAQHATQDVPPLPVATRELNPDRLSGVNTQIAARRDEIDALREMSRESLDIIKRMQDAITQRDRGRLDRLFEKLDAKRSRVEGDLKVAFDLVNWLNTVGAFRRARADRVLARTNHDHPMDKVGGQLKRDAVNIDGIVQACDEATSLITAAHARLHERYADVLGLAELPV